MCETADVVQIPALVLLVERVVQLHRAGKLDVLQAMPDVVKADPLAVSFHLVSCPRISAVRCYKFIQAFQSAWDYYLPCHGQLKGKPLSLTS